PAGNDFRRKVPCDSLWSKGARGDWTAPRRRHWSWCWQPASGCALAPALHLIARLYAVEERAKALSLAAEQRLALRQRVSARLLGKLHQYLLELQPEVLPKSPAGAAVRYALNQWEALTRFLEDGELEIDNGATE